MIFIANPAQILRYLEFCYIFMQVVIIEITEKSGKGLEEFLAQRALVFRQRLGSSVASRLTHKTTWSVSFTLAYKCHDNWNLTASLLKKKS